MSESSHAKTKTPLLGDGAYKGLKQTAALILPAAGALYFTLAQIWGLPKAEEVVGSIAAVNTFAGVVLGLSTRSYNKSDTKYAGDLVVEDHPQDSSVKMLVAHLNQDPQAVSEMTEATFRIDSTGGHPIVRDK